MRYLILLLLASAAVAADPINTRCPVQTDEAVDPAYSLTWEGHTIGFCCARCVRKFTADPALYAANLPALPVATAVPPPNPGEQVSGHDHQAMDGVAPPPMSSPTHDDGEHGGGHHHPMSKDPVTGIVRLGQWLGRFHPVIVHFPIALAILAVTAEVLFRLTRVASLQATARVAIFGAAVTAVPTVLLGWLAAMAPHPGMETVLEWHRWLGTAAGGILIAAAFASEALYRLPERRVWRWLAPAMGLLVAPLIGLVGHLGGVLVFGPDHFRW